MKEEKDKIKNDLNENNPNKRSVNKVKENEGDNRINDDYNKLLREKPEAKKMMTKTKN